MIKFVLLFFTFTLVIIYFFSVKSRQNSFQRKNSSEPVYAPSPISIPDNLQKIELNFANQPLIIYATEINQQTTMLLIPNFTNKESGLILTEKSHCQKAINGGFYQNNNKPLGLFISQGIEYGKEIRSNLVTGFFWQEKNGQRLVSRIKPEDIVDNLDFILQTGPFMTVGDYRLKLVSDEKTRRMLLALDKNNKLYIISVTDKNNSFNGPFLSDLPQIFHLPDIQKHIAVTTLLNLDGGAASYFYVSDGKTNFSLSEITPIGSLLCIK